MADENGWTDGYRPRFPITIKPVIEKLSRGKNRSPNNFIVRATLKEIIRSEVEKNIDAFIDELMSKGEKFQVLKCD